MPSHRLDDQGLVQYQALRQTKGQLQPLKLGRQQGDVHLGVQQLIAGPGDLLLRWVGLQPVPMDQFRDADLGRSVGLHKTGMGDEREALPRLGVLNFVEKNGGDQHWIHLMRRCLAQNHRLQLAKTIQGGCAQWLELIHPAGEQLGQLRLGAVHPEAPLQQLQFFGREICGLESVLHHNRRLIPNLSNRV